MLCFSHFQLQNPPHYLRSKDIERRVSNASVPLRPGFHSVLQLLLELPDLDFFILSIVNIQPLSSDLVLYNDFFVKKKKISSLCDLSFPLTSLHVDIQSVSWPPTIALPPMNGPPPALQRNVDKWEENVLIRGTRSLMKIWHSALPLALTFFLADRVTQWIILTVLWVDAIYNTMFAYILERSRESLM